MGVFESCVNQCTRILDWLRVNQCTRILDWLRVPKRQSNVNLYLSSFPGEKVCFHTGECEEMYRGSFEFSEYPLEKEKNYTNGRTGKSRFRRMCEMGLTSLHVLRNSTVRDICTFAVLCWVTRLFCRFTRSCS